MRGGQREEGRAEVEARKFPANNAPIEVEAQCDATGLDMGVPCSRKWVEREEKEGGEEGRGVGKSCEPTCSTESE